MATAKKFANSDRGACTRTEKQLLALLCVIASTIVLLMVWH
jgi:hypothetical protein